MTHAAHDGFEPYLAEKLWELVPGVYRQEDGRARGGGVLRAIVELLAEQAAVARRSHDRLWDDAFIETCDDWAVPYIGDLVATRLVAALNRRGRRADVAKTIYYRRRKGTLAVLEELIRDISGWDGIVVENFRRLARTRHGLDPKPAPLAGRISGTQPGGWADLRSAHGCELRGGLFDELHYTADVRRHRGWRGRHGLTKLAFHLHRLAGYRIEGVTPCNVGAPERYTFDPSGREVPLFAARRPGDGRREWDEWRSRHEWELSAPIRCRVMSDPEAREALVPGSMAVRSAAGAVIGPDDVIAADLESWTVPAPGAPLVVDPSRGRFRIEEGPPGDAGVTYCYGFSGEIGAGAYARTDAEGPAPLLRKSGGGIISAAEQLAHGTVRIDDSATYEIPVGPGGPIASLRIAAASGRRPYVKTGNPWRLDGGAAGGDERGALVALEGLWLGGGEMVLTGDFESVRLSCVTLDPGGTDAAGRNIAAVPLIVEGHVERLAIDRCIVASIERRGTGMVEELAVADTILQASGRGDIAISLPRTKARLARVTVLGAVNVKELHATETILAGEASVANLQAGCFRFGATGELNRGRLPRPFETTWLGDGSWPRCFTSLRFGDPGFAQLADAAPRALRAGAENGSELGAFSRLITPIKASSLDAKVTEYMPFGLAPIYLNRT